MRSQAQSQDLERGLAAIADPTRRGILLGFHRSPGPRTVDQVAAEAGVHRTVAFTHLERLAGLGHLAVERRRGLPGRPAKLYRLAGLGAVQLSHPPRQFEHLAVLLAAVATLTGAAGRRAVRRVGKEYGRSLARPAERVDEALEVLAETGAEYRHRAGLVTAANCVFREPCSLAPRVVCDLHAAILEGVLQGSGLDHKVVPASDYNGRCEYRVR